MVFPPFARVAWLALLAASAVAAADAAPDRADRLRRIAEGVEAGRSEVGSLVFALRNLSPTVEEGLPIYLRLLERDSDSARGYGLLGIAAYGSRGAAAASAVLQVIGAESSSAYVKGEALRCLDTLAVGDAAMVPLLVRCLRDPDLTPRAKAPALSVLARIGPPAAEAAPLAKAAFDDPDTAVAYEAYRAIGALAGAAPVTPTPGMAVAEQYASLADRRRAGDAAMIAEVLRRDERLAARAFALECLAGCAIWDEATTATVIDACGSSEQVIATLARADLLGEPVRGVVADPSQVPLAPLRDALADARAPVRMVAATALARLGPRAAPAAPALAAALRACDGKRSAGEIVLLLDAARAIGAPAKDVCVAIGELLAPQAAIFTGRSHREVQSLRGRMLATLAATGVPPAARPQVLDAVANPDPACLLEFVGAARAAASEGRAGAYAAGGLLQALDADFADDLAEPLGDSPASHRRLKPSELPRDAVSARVEAVRALAALGDAGALPRLRTTAHDGLPGAGNSELLKREAAAALARLGQEGQP